MRAAAGRNLVPSGGSFSAAALRPIIILGKSEKINRALQGRAGPASCKPIFGKMLFHKASTTSTQTSTALCRAGVRVFLHSQVYIKRCQELFSREFHGFKNSGTPIQIKKCVPGLKAGDTAGWSFSPWQTPGQPGRCWPRTARIPPAGPPRGRSGRTRRGCRCA